MCQNGPCLPALGQSNHDFIGFAHAAPVRTIKAQSRFVVSGMGWGVEGQRQGQLTRGEQPPHPCAE